MAPVISAVEVDISRQQPTLGPRKRGRAAGKEASGEGIVGPVRDRERLVEVLCLENRNHGAEDFLACDDVLRVHVHEHGRRHIGAPAQGKARGQARLKGKGRLGFPLLDDAKDLLLRLGVDHRTHHRCGIRRIANRQVCAGGGEAFHKPVVDSAEYNDPG